MTNIIKRITAVALSFAVVTGTIYNSNLTGAVSASTDPMAGMSKKELKYLDQDPYLFRLANEYGDGNIGYTSDGSAVNLLEFAEGTGAIDEDVFDSVDSYGVDDEDVLPEDVDDEAEISEESGLIVPDEVRTSTFAATTGTVKSPFTSSTYKHNPRYKGFAVANGIDVSEWQHNINWSKAKKAGVEFAIIRVGYRAGGTGKLYNDPYYRKNISGALRAGIKVGVYVFSQAISKAEGAAEARFLINRVGRYNITLPLVLDYEFLGGTSGRLYKAHLSKRRATDVCLSFCRTVENAGYTAMVYANGSMLSCNLYGSEISNKYMVWLANFGKNNGHDRNFATSYKGMYSFWQYTSTGHVGGISGNVDCNFWYLNSVAKSDSESSSSKSKTSEKEKEKKRAAAVATGISITDDYKTMKTGTSQVLYYALSPTGIVDTVTWTSSRNNVAYVKNGSVIAVSGGEAIITGTTSSGASDTIKIIVSENLSEYSIVGASSQTFTGGAVKPAVKVRSSSKLASTGKTKKKIGMLNMPDSNLGVVVKTVPKSKILTIYAASGSYYSCSYKTSSKTYYGYILKSKVSASTDYKTLLSGRDYDIKYSNNEAAGTALVEAVAADNSIYSGTTSNTFSISKVNIGDVTALGINDQANPTPDVRLIYMGKTLVKDTDYTVSYGAGTVTITGMGNFSGSRNLTYNAVNPAINIAQIEDQTYTGSAITPVIKDQSGNVLDANAGYALTFADNVNIGSASVTVTDGSGASAKVYYAILPKKIDSASIVVSGDAGLSYNQVAYEPEVTVSDAGRTLVKDVDYNVSYEDNTLSGTGKIIISGIGLYSGEVVKEFAIGTRSLNLVNIADIATQAYKGGSQIKPSINMTDSGTALLRDSDYEVTYSNNTERGTATAVIKGIGNYEGEITKTFTIGKKTISSCKILKITNKKKTGKKIKPSVTITNNGNKLVEGTDYTLSYGKNKKKGKGLVKIKGKGNYSGTKKVYFRIV